MKTIIKLSFLFSFFLLQFSAQAQAPEKMSYQAVIRNASNTLITEQAIGMRVSILQGSATGTEVYKELFNPNPQTNINGLVTVEIGTGLPITGTFSGIDWANGPYFIKTETDPTGGTSYTIVGTSQLLSTPYALYAKTSGNLGWGLSGNATSTTNFIGTTNNNDVVFKRNNVNAGRISETNTSFGLNTLTYNTTGNNNTASGIYALFSNTTGYSNTATGSFALGINETGFYNTAIGAEALSGNSSGNSNTAIGRRSLNSNTIGNSNTATGVSSLYSNLSGFDNTANGYDALYSNTTGYSNTAIGVQALSKNTIGRDNTAIGQNALHSNTIGVENTAIGSNALQSNISGLSNVAVGAGALNSLASGNNNIALGMTLTNLTSGYNNIGIGNGAQVPSATGSNQVRIGNTAITYAGIQVAWTVTSDSRWKENIKPSNLGLNFINDLKPVSYTRKNDDTKKLEYGIIAQELEISLNKFGANSNGIISKDDEGMYSVRYNDLLAPMIKAIQEQQLMIEELKAEIKILKNKK